MVRKICLIIVAACAGVAAVHAAAPKVPAPIFGAAPDANAPKSAGRPAVTDCAPNTTVTITNLPGSPQFCGIAGTSPTPTVAYLGIQYATAGRWQPPKPTVPQPSSTPYPATSFQSPCPQMAGTTFIGTENCLYLNIWTPSEAVQPAPLDKPRPVIVFIHGGAFITGSGGFPPTPDKPYSVYDGSTLAAQQLAEKGGAVVVTLNYRLGALGFLVTNTDLVQSVGNYGLMDQQKALEWVQAYIKFFGGDPGNVTLFGESAGAMSVGLHTFDMPASQTLFKNAIMESNPMGEYYLPNKGSSPTAPYAQTIGDQFTVYLCDVYYWSKLSHCAKNPGWENSSIITPEVIVKAQTKFLDYNTDDLKNHLTGIRTLSWQPNVDGTTVVGEPYDGFATYGTQTMKAKAVAFGVNKDEGVLFAAGLAFGLDPYAANGEPTTDFYGELLGYTFPNTPPTNISTHAPYNPASLAAQPYYSASGQALADVITDFMFLCGNEYAAKKILTQSTEPVYAYYFSQTPFFDLYNPGNQTPPVPPAKPFPDNSACAPNSNPDNVCHGNELPYVFSSLGAIEGNSKVPGTRGPYTPSTSNKDLALAGTMTAAWYQFALNPQAALRDPWVAFTDSGTAAYNALVFNGTAPAGSTISLDSTGQCSSFWFPMSPYAPPG